MPFMVEKKDVEDKKDVEEKNDVEENNEFEEKLEGEEKLEVVEVEDNHEEVVLPIKGDSHWELTIGSPNNVVAYATVDMDSDARVSITRVIHGDAKIPFPINDEIMTVEQAVGTYIAWPRSFMFKGKTRSAPVKGTLKGGKKLTGSKFKKVTDCVSEPEYVVKMDAEYPQFLRRFWFWSSDALKDGRVCSFELCQEDFGSSNKKVLFLSDVHALCFGGEISGSTICMFINLLEENLRKHKMTNMISFVDPGIIGAIGCGTPGERSRALAVRFKNAKQDQFFFCHTIIHD